MNIVNLVNAYCCFENLVCIILRCLCHLNFQSSQTPRNLADSTDAISAPESHTICLDRTYIQVKCISSLFFRANAIPLIIAHLSYTTYTHSKHSQFTVTSLLYTIRLISSANPTMIIPSPSSSSYNKAIYRMNRIRNNNDPCGTPVWSFQRTASASSN